MLPQRIGVAEQTAQTVAFHQIGVVVSKHPFGQLVVVIVMILLVRHIAEVQREHPTVTVDDVLRQTGQRMIDETLMVAVGVFHRHQREEGGIFVRTVFRDHQRRKTQRYRTVQRRDDIMPVRILTEPDLFALEQYRFLIVFIDFQQREQTALIVSIGQSRRITDKCAGNQACSSPRRASRYRLGRNNSCGSKPAAAALQEIQGLGGSFPLGLLFM